MKFFFDFFPTLVFFFVYKLFGIFPATYAIITASLLQIGVFWLKNKTIESMHVILLLMVLVFGGLTIYFHDIRFLMWKVSIVNWLMGSGFLLSHFFKKNIIAYFFDFANQRSTEKISIPPLVIKKLNLAWGFFLIGLGCVNLYIAFHYSVNTWVNFKVFGVIGLILIFVALQAFYLNRFLKDTV